MKRLNYYVKIQEHIFAVFLVVTTNSISNSYVLSFIKKFFAFFKNVNDLKIVKNHQNYKLSRPLYNATILQNSYHKNFQNIDYILKSNSSQNLLQFNYSSNILLNFTINTKTHAESETAQSILSKALRSRVPNRSFRCSGKKIIARILVDFHLSKTEYQAS